MFAVNVLDEGDSLSILFQGGVSKVHVRHKGAQGGEKVLGYLGEFCEGEEGEKTYRNWDIQKKLTRRFAPRFPSGSDAVPDVWFHPRTSPDSVHSQRFVFLADNFIKTDGKI